MLPGPGPSARLLAQSDLLEYSDEKVIDLVVEDRRDVDVLAPVSLGDCPTLWKYSKGVS